MRIIPTGPGRANAYPDPGDRVALCDNRGVPVGPWHVVPPDRLVKLTVPPDGPPCRSYLIKTAAGMEWWEETVFFPSLRAGDTAEVPLPVPPAVRRVPKPGPC